MKININDLINNFVSTESMLSSDEQVDKYKNSPCGEAFEILDNLESYEVSMESMAEGVRSMVSYNQDAVISQAFAFESNGTLESITAGYMSGYEALVGGSANYSMEAANIIEQAKRAGYNTKTNIKELINKVITWVMGCIDYFVAVDSHFKSYVKMIKKYKEKMNKGDFNTSDKEVSIKNCAYGSLVTSALSIFPSNTVLTANKNKIRAVDKIADMASGFAAVVEALVVVEPVASVDSQYKLPIAGDAFGKDFATKSKDLNTATGITALTSAVNDCISEKTRETDVNEWCKEISDLEYEDRSARAALDFLNTQASVVISKLNVDFKLKKGFADIASEMEKVSKKLNSKEAKDGGGDNVGEMSTLVVALGALIMNHRSKVVGKITKCVQSELQVLIKDMAKVINFNTTIKAK